MGGATRQSWVDRLLGATGDEPSGVAQSKLQSFRRLLFLIVAAESWHALHFPAYGESPTFHVGVAVALTGCAALAWLPRFERGATVVGVALAALDLASVFPENANHQVLGLVALALLALVRPRVPAEEQAVVQALRWLVPIGFFWGGVQKVFHGYWFGGEFLAVRIATDPSFALALAPFLSAQELARLSALVLERGSGPFRVDEPLFLLLANGAWITELALAPLLLLARTRVLAAVGVIVFMIAIEVGARELFFGMMMISLALLYTQRDVNRIALPIFALAIAILMGTSAGLLPAWSFG